jgi:hypothetical protein
VIPHRWQDAEDVGQASGRILTMANAPWFARPRALKLMASLCVLCALAFMLGQETAAYRAVQLQMQTATATSHTTTAPPIPAISTAAAQGSAVAASQAVAPAAVFIAGVSHPAPDNGHASQHGKHGKHSKDGKQHDAKQHAAGDSSHGGMHHHGGGSHHHDSRQHGG